MKESLFVKLAHNFLRIVVGLGPGLMFAHTIYSIPTLVNEYPANWTIVRAHYKSGLEPFRAFPPSLNIKSADLNLEENLRSLDQAESVLMQYARIKYLTPPSKIPYEDGRGTIDEFSPIVAEIFDNKRNGIFIEAGAKSWALASSTLYLEKHLNWKGLLVECNPNLVPKLKSLYRKAWIASVCLAHGTKPGKLNISVPDEPGVIGHVEMIWLSVDFLIKEEPSNSFQLEAETMPLFTLLAALGFNDVDYFSFAINGSELAVLRTFLFDRVTFKLLKIEVEFYDDEQKKEMDELLRANYFHFVSDFGQDKIYVHESVKNELNLKRFKKSWWSSFW